MNSCELVAFVTGVACVLFDCMEDEEVALLAAVFSQLGDTLVTMSAQQAACKARGEREKGEEETV